MTSHEPLLLESGDLSISPELREVRNLRGECTRLGPINMNVLALLVSRPGEVISRAEIFESVWRNQVVGDDVLTRAISDIRSAVNRLSEHEGLIETLPKRGYRWTGEVREAAPNLRGSGTGRRQAESVAEGAGADSDRPLVHSPGAPIVKPRGEPMPPERRKLLVLAARAASYAALLVLIATVGAWLMGQLAGPGRPIVAVLPVISEPAQHSLAARVEQQLGDYLLHLDRVDLLARSAVESRPVNPFPYFYHAFGASWLIEAELEPMSPETTLTVNVVDARTGIVLLQSSVAVDDDPSPDGASLETIFRPLAGFFEAQARR